MYLFYQVVRDHDKIHKYYNHKIELNMEQFELPSFSMRHSLSGGSMSFGPWRGESSTVVSWSRRTINTCRGSKGVRYQSGQTCVKLCVTAVQVVVVTIAAVACAGYFVSMPVTWHGVASISVDRLSLVLHCHTSSSCSVVELPDASLN